MGMKDQFLKLGVFQLGEKEPKSGFGKIPGSEEFRLISSNILPCIILFGINKLMLHQFLAPHRLMFPLEEH
jgi:hypothetical protein